jgi:tripartite-type tricarboxylate transporter receptor subunit TctC
MRRIRCGILSTLLALSAAAIAAPASVQDYPSKPIRLIVPFAAGGGNDGVARIVAQKLSQSLRQQVIVDNRGGAGGNIAADIAAHATPDGYTLFLLNSANLIAPSLYEHITYDPIRDFAPVTMMVTSSFLIVAPIDSPLHTLGDLLIQAPSLPEATEARRISRRSCLRIRPGSISYTFPTRVQRRH